MSVLQDVQEAVAAAAEDVGPAVVAVGGWRHAGSGFVIDSGKILTNAHNIAGDEVRVVFADGREATGEVVGIDDDADLAVVAVDTGDAPPVTWADDAGDVALGTPVLALARHHRGALRVTQGWVAATGRSFRGPRGQRIDGAFEHTAPLARGSSGGPVVDAAGRVLGVDTNRVGEGFYLAVPATRALRERVEALARGESPQTPRLGLAVAPSRWARQARAAVGLEQRDGLLVRAVEEDSPAARAGVRRGDLIVRAGDRPVTAIDDLHAALRDLGEATTLALDLVRGEQETSVTVSFATTGEHGTA